MCIESDKLYVLGWGLKIIQDFKLSSNKQINNSLLYLDVLYTFIYLSTKMSPWQWYERMKASFKLLWIFILKNDT
jgi:hypothetical protein